MGMAASQARYLALVARKSNCEYEGQQINQSRTVLSNQSANLFNQMLGLSVPIPPSTQDFTTKQYSIKTGNSARVIDKWEQLATPEGEYNYVVTSHYFKDVYTGSQKQMNDPQVQFSEGSIASVPEIEAAIDKITNAEKEYNEELEKLNKLEKEAASITKYQDTTTYPITKGWDYSTTTSTFVIKGNDSDKQAQITRGGKPCPLYEDPSTNKLYYKISGEKEEQDKYFSINDQEITDQELINKFKPVNNEVSEFVNYDKITDNNTKTTISDSIQALVDIGALPKDAMKDLSKVYYDTVTGSIAFEDDIRALNKGSDITGNNGLTVYKARDAQTTDSILYKTNQYNTAIQKQKDILNDKTQAKEDAIKEYEALQKPTYIGNCELNLLTSLTSDEEAELQQVLKDMRNNNIKTSINNCFDAQGNYLGGVYKFKMNGEEYYTTFDELSKAYASGDGINHIDGQDPLTYYNATYVSTRIEETEKALLETDETGRFTTVRFENDSVTYPLNVENITDEKAYDDAMNKFYYENAKYDKMVQDINAKTKIIQQQDQQLELRLKQLDTEQNALSNEIEAVSKVVKDNVDKSFKTFGG